MLATVSIIILICKMEVQPQGPGPTKAGVSILTLIYVRRVQENYVLLGLKKRGFGAGKFNGFGGKVESGETIEEGAVRELQEEAGLETGVDDIRKVGTLTYVYDSRPKQMQVHVFEVCTWKGEPQETEEMQPAWYSQDDMPLKKMWADDVYWLHQYLVGELEVPFEGYFRFKGHEGPDSEVILEHTMRNVVS